MASCPQRIFISLIHGAPPPLLSAVRVAVVVAVVVAVLALRLLVAEQVAPPAPGVVHLFGRSGAVGLPHPLQGKTNTFKGNALESGLPLPLLPRSPLYPASCRTRRSFFGAAGRISARPTRREALTWTFL